MEAQVQRFWCPSNATNGHPPTPSRSAIFRRILDNCESVNWRQFVAVRVANRYNEQDAGTPVILHRNRTELFVVGEDGALKDFRITATTKKAGRRTRLFCCATTCNLTNSAAI
jgi:hypothetical protein